VNPTTQVLQKRNVTIGFVPEFEWPEFRSSEPGKRAAGLHCLSAKCGIPAPAQNGASHVDIHRWDLLLCRDEKEM
jgi:hypothetical protein